jgi:hypothetical protein
VREPILDPIIRPHDLRSVVERAECVPTLALG